MIAQINAYHVFTIWVRAYVFGSFCYGLKENLQRKSSTKRQTLKKNEEIFEPSACGFGPQQRSTEAIGCFGRLGFSIARIRQQRPL